MFILFLICTLFAPIYSEATSLEKEELTDAIFPRTDPKLIGDLYQILKVIDIELANHSIPYWLEFGSLLGSERHKGIIPWDDDVDICMLASDRGKLNQLGSVFNKYGLVAWGVVGPGDGRILPATTSNFDIVRVYREHKPYPWVDIFFAEPETVQNEIAYKLIGRPRGWFPKCIWYADEITSLIRKPFGPIQPFSPACGVMRRLIDQYGPDCMEWAVNVTNHGTRNDTRKVRVVDLNPAPYISDNEIISLP